MLNNSKKSILRALALILAVLMTASVCLVGCSDKDAQAAAADAKSAADAAAKTADEAKAAAASAVSQATLTAALQEYLKTSNAYTQAQATADIANALAAYAKKAELDAAVATANGAVAQFSAELAKLVKTGDVYTKAEIDSKLAAIGGTGDEDTAAAIADALAEAKKYTDDCIAKIGTGTSGELPEDVIDVVLQKAFEGWDAATDNMVLALGKIAIDCLKIYASTYRTEDFKAVYAAVESYLGKVDPFEGKEGYEFGDLSSQDRVLEYFEPITVITTVLGFFRATSVDDLNEMVAAFDAAAAVKSIDEAVKELADELAAIGTVKELKNVPAKLIDVTGTDCKLIGLEGSTVADVDKYAGKLLTTTMTDGVETTIDAIEEDGYYYVQNADGSYDIFVATKDVDAGKAVAGAEFEIVSTKVFTVADAAKVEAFVESCTTFVEWTGIKPEANKIILEIRGKKVGGVYQHRNYLIGNWVEDAFSKEDGQDDAYILPILYIAPPDVEEGILNLISDLKKVDDEYVQEVPGIPVIGNIQIPEDLAFAITSLFIGNSEAEVYLPGAEKLYELINESIEFASKTLAANAAAAAAKLTDDKGNLKKVTEVVTDSDTPDAAVAKYKKIVAALEEAIKDYEMYNLLAADADVTNETVLKAIAVLNGAKAIAGGFDEEEAAKAIDDRNKQTYTEKISEIVANLHNWASNTLIDRVDQKFTEAVIVIVDKFYFEAAAVGYENALPLIQAKTVDGFATKTDAYLYDIVYAPAQAEIKEAYAEYCRWPFIKADTLKSLQDYIDQFEALVITATNSNKTYFVSNTDHSKDLYYTIGEAFFGFAGAEGKAKLDAAYKAYVDELTAAIDAKIAVVPESYAAECDAIAVMYKDTVNYVAEAFLKLVDAKIGLTDSLKAAAKAALEASITDWTNSFLTSKGINTYGLNTDAIVAKIDDAFKATADNKFPIMSTLGWNVPFNGEIIPTPTDAAKFVNTYDAKVEALKADALKAIYDLWFTQCKKNLITELSTYYYGANGVQALAGIDAAHYSLFAADLKGIYEPNYKKLNSYVAEYSGNTVASTTEVINKLEEEMKTIVSETCLQIGSYTAFCVTFTNMINDYADLLAGIKAANKTLNFYAAGSKFDKAVIAFEAAINAAKFYPLAVVDTTAKATATCLMPHFGTKTDYDFTGLIADGKFTPVDYEDNMLFAAYNIDLAIDAMDKLWDGSNQMTADQKAAVIKAINAATVSYQDVQ